MLSNKKKTFLGLVTSVLLWLYCRPGKLFASLFSRSSTEPKSEEFVDNEITEESPLPPGYDVEEQTRALLQGFHELVAKWNTNITMLESEYARGTLQWRRLGMMKLNPIRTEIERYMGECAAGMWPKEVDKILALAVNRITKAYYHLHEEPKVPVIDMTSGSVDPNDLSFRIGKNCHVPNHKEKPKA
jgi:hypothetical protein